MIQNSSIHNKDHGQVILKKKNTEDKDLNKENTENKDLNKENYLK